MKHRRRTGSQTYLKCLKKEDHRECSLCCRWEKFNSIGRHYHVKSLKGTSFAEITTGSAATLFRDRIKKRTVDLDWTINALTDAASPFAMSSISLTTQSRNQLAGCVFDSLALSQRLKYRYSCINIA